MNFNVILHLVLWFLLIFFCGNLFWITFHPIFSKLWDRGYVISKILFFVILALFLWTAGFIFKMPINTPICIGTIVLFSSCLLGIKYYFKIPFPKEYLKKALFLEIIFILFLAISLGITSIHAPIDNITERLMDFLILNNLSTHSTLPAADFWFVGKNINYYYFGYFFWSIFNKTLFTDPYMGYLFAISFIFGLGQLIIFSLALSIRKNIIFAVLASSFVFFFSNFSFIFDMLNKFYVTLPSEKTFNFWMIIIESLLLFSCLFSLIFIKRKNTRLIMIISIIGILLISFFTKSYESLLSFKDYALQPSGTVWFPDVSRVISSTINEFPFYSIIVGDLHPHVLDLIFLPVIITLLFLDFKLITPKKSLITAKYFKKSLIQSKELKYISKLNFLFKQFIGDKLLLQFTIVKILTLLIFSASLVTNSWDAIVIAIFVFIKDLIFIYKSFSLVEVNSNINIKKLIKVIAFPIVMDLFFGIGALLIQFPYFKSIQSPVKGLKLNLINNPPNILNFFKDNFDIFSIFKYFSVDSTGTINLLYGLDRIFILFIFIYLFYTYTSRFLDKKINLKKYLIKISILILATIFINAFVGTLINYIQHAFDLSPFIEFVKVWLFFYLFFFVFLIYFLILALRKEISRIDYFLLTCFITGIFLSIFTELFYVADYFDRIGYQHHRANTVFKINYIGFVFLGLGSAWCLMKIIDSRFWQRKHENDIKHYLYSSILSFIRSFLIIGVIGTFIYVPFAINQWVTYFPENLRFSLDAYAKTKEKYPDIMQAVEYFNKIKTDKDVILETNGDGYKLQSYFSVYTSTPTILGWWGHEGQWRETVDPTEIDNILNDRVAEISKVYTLASGWQDVLKKYNITYIWVGDGEREKQGANVTNVFDSEKCLKKEFENTSIKLFKVDYGCINN